MDERKPNPHRKRCSTVTGRHHWAGESCLVCGWMKADWQAAEQRYAEEYRATHGNTGSKRQVVAEASAARLSAQASVEFLRQNMRRHV